MSFVIFFGFVVSLGVLGGGDPLEIEGTVVVLAAVLVVGEPTKEVGLTAEGEADEAVDKEADKDMNIAYMDIHMYLFIGSLGVLGFSRSFLSRRVIFLNSRTEEAVTLWIPFEHIAFGEDDESYGQVADGRFVHEFDLAHLEPGVASICSTEAW